MKPVDNCTISFGSAEVHGFDVYIRADPATGSIAAGLGMNYISFGSGNDELDLIGDFEFGLTVAGLELAAAVGATRPAPWMDPFGTSQLMGVVFPLAVEVSIVITPIPAPPFVAVVVNSFMFEGGMIAPAGISPRYPVTSGDLFLQTLLIANLRDFTKSALMVNGTNLFLGRMLYSMGLYKLDGFCSPTAPPPPSPALPPSSPNLALSPPQPPMPSSCSAAGSADQRATMNELLDILDTVGVQDFSVSVNMGADDVCSLGVCVSPGIHFELKNLDLFGLTTVEEVAFDFSYELDTTRRAPCAPHSFPRFLTHLARPTACKVS